MNRPPALATAAIGVAPVLNDLVSGASSSVVPEPDQAGLSLAVVALTRPSAPIPGCSTQFVHRSPKESICASILQHRAAGRFWWSDDSSSLYVVVRSESYPRPRARGDPAIVQFWPPGERL